MGLETSVDLSKLGTSEGVIANARIPETVDALEELTSGWCQQIEQVLIISMIDLSHDNNPFARSWLRAVR